jgi:FHS family L-fucose permease-like MFS transporter
VAGTLVGTYWFLMLIGRLLGGLVGGKVSSKAMLSAVAVLAIVFVLLAMYAPLNTIVNMPVFRSDISFGFTAVPISFMFFVLCGLCTSVMWGSIFNLATAGLGKYVAAASGLFMMMVCGGGILPLLQGKVADMFGFMTSFWVIFAGLLYILFFALIGSKNVNKDIKVD